MKVSDPITRRRALLNMLAASSGLALRALATGLPPALIANPLRALAQETCLNPSAAQYLILSTSSQGDPSSCNVPGTYIADPNLMHPTDPSMAPVPLVLGGQTYQAAAPWAQLNAATLARTCFFHHATETVVHAQESQVMQLMGRVANHDMLVSVLSAALAPCLGTIQPQPICLSSGGSLESISYQGLPQPMLEPTALGAILGGPGGSLASLQSLRDKTLASITSLLKSDGNPTQLAQIDQFVISQQEVRSVSQDLIGNLAAITDNTAASQIKAAILLVQMKMSPVITIHIPFGADNHADPLLAGEASAAQTGVQTIAGLMTSLQAAALQDQVTFGLFNVFGRTMSLALKGYNGRDHNGAHNAGILIGKRVNSSVIGGVAATGVDYGATSINPQSGASGGSIAPSDSLAAFGKTMGGALGLTEAQMDPLIIGGTIVTAAVNGAS